MRALLPSFVAVALVVAAPAAVAQAPSGKPPTAKAPAKPPPAKPPPAPPQEKNKKPVEVSFSAEVMILHATNSSNNKRKKKGIDPRIGKMPELEKPPFSAYDTYDLISNHKVQLKVEGNNLTLPNGRVLQTKLVEVLADKEHIKLSASINQPGGRTFLPLLEVKAKTGQTFIVAGQKHKGGILVLRIKVLKD
jgi:hypothetical protein